MLEGLVDVEVEHGAGLEEQLDTEQRRGGPDRRGVAERRAEEDPGLPAGRGERRRHVVLEVGGVVAGGVGERDPQLDAVQRGGAGGRDLRVAHAAAAGHQVELAGTDQRLVAGRVTVLDLAGEQPAHRLQAGVRVRRHDHPAGVVDLVGTVVVGEAPGPHERTTALREGTAHGHRPQPAQRDLARGQHLGHASDLLRLVVGLLRLAHLRDVVLRPRLEVLDRVEQRVAEVGQRVVDADRDGRRHGAGDQAVALQGAQGLGQHLLADPGQLPGQLGEPQRAVGERRDHQGHPLVGDPVEHQPARAVGEERVELLLRALALLRRGHGRHRGLLRTSGCLPYFKVPASRWEATRRSYC